MKVSASFLSSKNIPNDLRKLNTTDIDYIHVDVMDGIFVKNKTMPFSEMKHISKYTNKRLEVHLMVDDPIPFISQYSELNTEFIIVHVEARANVLEAIDKIKSYGIKAGISIKPNTPVSRLIPYLPFVDEILVMSVEPGEGGQPFIEETEERIKEIRTILSEYNMNIIINVDGGVNDKTRALCSECDMVTSGSYITSSDDFQEAISTLR